MGFADPLGEGFAGAVFAVGEDHAGFARGELFEPAFQLGFSRVGAEPAECVDFGADGDGFPEDAHFGCALDEFSPERARCLVAYDQHVGVVTPEVLPEVVQNASCVAHARASHDQARALHVIDRFRLVGRQGRFDGREILRERMVCPQGLHLLVVELGVLHVNFRRLRAHRRVDEHREGLDAFLTKQHREIIENLLRASHREGGHEDFTFARDGLLENRGEFLDGVFERTVVSAAIGGLHEDHVRLREALGVFEDRGVAGTEVAGKDDASGLATLFDDQLNAR